MRIDAPPTLMTPPVMPDLAGSPMRALSRLESLMRSRYRHDLAGCVTVMNLSTRLMRTRLMKASGGADPHLVEKLDELQQAVQDLSRIAKTAFGRDTELRGQSLGTIAAELQGLLRATFEMGGTDLRVPCCRIDSHFHERHPMRGWRDMLGACWIYLHDSQPGPKVIETWLDPARVEIRWHPADQPADQPADDQAVSLAIPVTMPVPPATSINLADLDALAGVHGFLLHLSDQRLLVFSPKHS